MKHRHSYRGPARNVARRSWRMARAPGLAAALLVAVCVSSVVPASSGVAAVRRRSPQPRAWTNEAGIEHLHFRTAPINVLPGQNSVQMVAIPRNEKPTVDGYIVRMRPDVQYLDGRVPPVNVIHLHHGVWSDAKHGPFFFGGEEKTVFHIPRGYGYPYKASDRWTLDQMIHNQRPVPTRVRLVWDIDLIPASSALARTVKPVIPVWLDVRGGEDYPVFNSMSGSGEHGAFTYPTDAKNPYGGHAPLNEVRVPFDGTIVSAVGHIHPGGLYDTIELFRPGAALPTGRACRRESIDITDSRSATRCAAATPGSTAHSVRIFRAQAHYYEPAGPVSWDFALTASRPDWRVRVRKGDTLRITNPYTSNHISWYENMGIALLFVAPGDRSGVDPFSAAVDWRGVLTHGHLAENNVHGGARTSIVDVRKLPNGPLTTEVRIKGYTYRPGDLSLLGEPGARIPTVRQGH